MPERHDITNHPLNPLNTELNPICHLLALVGAHHLFHVSRIRVKFLKSIRDELIYMNAVL
jgi:transposase